MQVYKQIMQDYKQIMQVYKQIMQVYKQIMQVYKQIMQVYKQMADANNVCNSSRSMGYRIQTTATDWLELNNNFCWVTHQIHGLSVMSPA